MTQEACVPKARPAGLSNQPAMRGWEELKLSVTDTFSLCRGGARQSLGRWCRDPVLPGGLLEVSVVEEGA